MSKRLHETSLLDRIPDHGRLSVVIPAADNSSCAFHMTDEDSGAENEIFFHGKLCAKGAYTSPQRSLSFDGKSLATAEEVIEDDRITHHVVKVHGERGEEVKRFTAPISTLYHLDWLSNNELAWNGWNEGEQGRVDDNGIRCFLNGEEMTGRMEFEPFWGERYADRIFVSNREARIGYWIDGYGNRSEARPLPDDSERFPGVPAWVWEKPLDQPEAVWNADRSKGHVVFRGVSGPEFDKLESKFMTNNDYSRVGYVGANYSRMASMIGRWVAGSLNGLEEKEEKSHRMSVRAWILALLFNPYFGLGYGWIEGSQRWRPVDHDRAWRKAYRFADDHFYTPRDEFVVTACDAGKQRVVIDEDKGPLFDAIYHAVFAPGEDAVSYLARRDSEIFRILVR